MPKILMKTAYLLALSKNFGIVFSSVQSVLCRIRDNTDRGTEFLNPEAIECDRYGEIKTELFYCDPQCAWQKGALEKNHEFIRYIVPKGTSFDDLTQADITLITNHINSLARDKYHGKTPYQLSKVLIDNKLHEFMKLVEIKPDEVFLKPALIKRQRRQFIRIHLLVPANKWTLLIIICHVSFEMQQIIILD